MANGTMQVLLKGYDDVVDQLNYKKTMKQKAEKVVSRTLGDFRTRGPGWVSQEVVKEYNIKKADVNETKKGFKKNGTAKVKGLKIDNLSVEYEGRLLTPTHFGMTPKARPAKGTYAVSAKFRKMGSPKILGSKVFLANSGGEGTVQIPFQRRGDARLPVDVVKTLSVPQMITNDTVSSNISSRVNAELSKRLAHNMQRLMKK